MLLGQTKGYRFHPQLQRFRETPEPRVAIGAYLRGIVDESRARSYNFDASKILATRQAVSMPVTRGQLEFELDHLRRKLRIRDRTALHALNAAKLRPHPIFRVTRGGIAAREIT